MYIKRTKAEFDTMRGLNLESIPKYIEFNTDAIWTKSNGEEVKVCYVVMENVEGIELIDLFNNLGRRATEPELRYVFSYVALALHNHVWLPLPGIQREM